MPWEGVDWPYTRKYNIGDQHAYPSGDVTMTLTEAISVAVLLAASMLVLALLRIF